MNSSSNESHKILKERKYIAAPKIPNNTDYLLYQQKHHLSTSPTSFRVHQYAPKDVMSPIVNYVLVTRCIFHNPDFLFISCIHHQSGKKMKIKTVLMILVNPDREVG